MSKVGIITDSTAYIPDELVAKHNIRIAPAVVIWSGEEFRDGIDIKINDFYDRLAVDKELPTTSQPSPGVVKQLYDEVLAEGKDVLGIFISEKLSGTIDSARQAKEMLPEANIEIVDTYSVSMGAGWPILLAARAADRGASLAECKAIAENARENVNTFFVVDTLEFLARGGRLSGAKRFLGTVIQAKPILEVATTIEGLEQVRTRKKALARLVDLVEERIAGRSPVYMAAIHANDPETAQELLEVAKARFNPVETMISDLSPGVGVHGGPGTVGLAFMAGVE